jgi:outer membrane protein TolC
MISNPAAAAHPAIPAPTRVHTKSFLLLVILACALPVNAQISLTTAVTLALKNSPKVKMAADDLAKAIATLQETHDVYLPSASAGAGLGQAYGYSPYPPTLFTGEAHSLAYSSSQFSYTRSARAGLGAAELSLKDARDAVTEDVALTYVALLKNAQREDALHQQIGFAQRLVAIVQDRFDAGRDTGIDLTQSKLTLAQLNLSLIRAEDDTLNDQAHLGMLISLPATALQTDGSFPAITIPDNFAPGHDTLSAGVAAAFETAQARQEQARGDSHFLYRPVIQFIVQYNRYATFTQSFQNIQKEYQATTPGGSISANSQVYGIKIDIPLFDKGRQAKARESAADAAHAQHNAEDLQQLAIDGQIKLTHSIRELHARMDVATLDQQLSQQQLDALVTELSRPPLPGRPPLTPKDEQNSRIAERERFLSLIDTTFQLRQLEINLLRQTGRLDEWLRTAISATPTP